MSELSKINKVSETTKSAIKRKSAQTLPNNPSARGYSAEEIKRRFYQPIIDATNSALTEIDRVVEEVNNAITQVNSNLNTFIEATSIKESYKLNLDWTVWVKNSNSGMYEVTITNKQHGITNYKEIGVDMYLLDSEGNYIKVNQFEINTNGNIRCFHEFNSVGFVSVYVKREGFVVGNVLTDIDHIIGLSKVGKTNDYNDLDNKPNLSQLDSNEALLTNIINGTQKVNSSIHADNAKNADYSSVSGFTDKAVNAENSEKAVGDQFGVNIHNNYCKKNGTYPNVSVGTAESANKAKCDEAGNNILSSYAQQNGEYQSMTVGKAKEADMSTKAFKDGNGAEIAKTYAKATGVCPNLTAGQAINAINDDLGRKISETYLTSNDILIGMYPVRFYVFFITDKNSINSAFSGTITKSLCVKENDIITLLSGACLIADDEEKPDFSGISSLYIKSSAVLPNFVKINSSTAYVIYTKTDIKDDDIGCKYETILKSTYGIYNTSKTFIEFFN